MRLMEMIHQPNVRPVSGATSNDSGDFAVLRAMIAARQAATPTAVALASATARPEDRLPTDTARVSLIDLFARGSASDTPRGGFTHVQPVARQDERHA